MIKLDNLFISAGIDVKLLLYQTISIINMKPITKKMAMHVLKKYAKLPQQCYAEDLKNKIICIIN